MTTDRYKTSTAKPDFTSQSRARRQLLGGIAATAAGAAAGPLATLVPRDAAAQDAWPNKPIRFIVPYPAGGVVDVIVRTVAEKVAISLGQPVIVETKPGASAGIGTETALRAPADGYTFLFGAPFLVTNPMLLPATTKWKTSDFTGVALIGAPPNLFVVPASSPIKSMRELVDYVKARPGQVNVTNPGNGTSNHLGQELLFNEAGMDMQNVMYKGQPEMLLDVLSGQVSFSLATMALTVPHIRDGKLRALAINAPRRAPDLPDVPTIAEAGYPGAMFLPWYGMVAVAATPKPIVKRMSDEILKALAMPDVITRLEKIGTLMTPGSGEDFDKLIASETPRWAKVIQQRGIKPAS